MSEGGEIKVVLDTYGKLATRSAGLVRRGLNDLGPLEGNKRRVLVISDEEAIGETYVPFWQQNGCEAADCNPERNGKWVFNEALAEAVAFRPNITLLYTNFNIWAQGSAFRNFVLRLFELLPDSRFVFILISHFDQEIYAKTIGCIQGLGFKFEVLSTLPEKEELLRIVRG